MNPRFLALKIYIDKNSTMYNQKKIDRLHEAACKRGLNGYIDPRSGYFVLTAIYLKQRGFCCGAGCRHCPYPIEQQRAAGRPESKGTEPKKGA